MKAIIISASVLEGVSTKKNPNGNSYEIASVKYLKALESFDNRDGVKHTKLTGYGFEVKEMQLDPSKLDQFQKVKFGTEVDLIREDHPRFDDKLWCVGVK